MVEEKEGKADLQSHAEITLGGGPTLQRKQWTLGNNGMVSSQK